MSLFHTKKDITKSGLVELTTFVTEVNAAILKRYGETYPVLSEANLAFSLWTALRNAQKRREDFHRVWAARTLLEIAINHPFGDANKRTSYVIAKLILRWGGYDFEVGYENAKQYLIKIASKTEKYDDVYKWIYKHSRLTNEVPDEEIKHFISLLEKAIK